MNQADSEFDADVNAWIYGCLQRGTFQFSEIVSMLPGVAPDLLRERVLALPQFSRAVQWSRPAPISRISLDLLRPIPHPLDFDWRFDSRTVESVCGRLSLMPGDVALLGAPSIWRAFQKREGSARFRLLDINAPDSDGGAASARRIDLLRDELADHSPADVAFLDPPWYPDATRGFVWAASKLLRDDGVMLICLPPVGTRPGILAERSELQDFAAACGFALDAAAIASVRYLSPPFERAVFRTIGIDEFVPYDWRQGELAAFRKTTSCSHPRPAAPPDPWREASLGEVRIKVDLSHPDTSADASLISLVADDILPSVSRRHPLREHVRVWTSGNRVFDCKAPHRLVDLIGRLSLQHPLSPCDSAAAEQLRRLVAAEVREY